MTQPNERSRPRGKTDRPVADLHLWEMAGTRDILWLVLLLLLLWVGYALRAIFTPVLLGLGLAYLFNPLITLAETRWRVPRALTISLVLLFLTSAVVATLMWLGPTFSSQILALADSIPRYVSSLASQYQLEIGDLSTYLVEFSKTLKDDPWSILSPLFTGTGQAFGVIRTIIGSTIGVTVMLVLVPIYFFLFAWDFERMTSGVMHLIPAKYRPRASRIFQRMDRAVSGFFRGRLMIGLITAGLYSFGWALADVPYWFLLGTATGLLTIIPYASAIGWPLAILLKYVDVLASPDLSISWLTILVWPSLPYLIVQFIESWILTPWIQSQSLDLSAATVLIAVFIGGAVAGFFGLLLAIPVAASIKILFQEFIRPRLGAEPDVE